MTAKHTPGPWMWDDDYRGLYGAGPNNEVLCYAGYEGMWVTHGITRDANARLIASAPDLLAALEYWFDSKATPQEIATKARAAIARARGE